MNKVRVAHRSESSCNNIILIHNIGRYRTPNPRRRETGLELIGLESRALRCGSWEKTRGLLGRANVNHLGSIDDRWTTLTFLNPIASMDTEQTRRRIPNFQFRVLIIGRANAGKTSILQRVCETTQSPTIYRGNEEVRGPSFCLRIWSHCRPGYT